MAVKDLTNIAIYLTIMIVSQMALAFLINVQIVYVLLLIHLHNQGLKQTLLLAVLFSILMGLVYGFGLYIIGYLYIYPFIIFFTYITTLKYRQIFFLAVIGLIAGYLFGFLFSIQDSYIYQIPFNVYWIRGLPYDTIHGVSNFFTIWILYPILKDKQKE